MLRFALRNLVRHKGRTAMTLAAIVLGIVAVILSGGFIEDVFVKLRDATIHSRLGFLQVYRAGFYERGRTTPYEFMIDEPDPLIDRLAELPGVVDILKRVKFSGLLNNGRTDHGIIGEGVEPDKETRLSGALSIIEGRGLTGDDADAVLIGEGVARRLAVAPGDFVNLLATTTDGAMNSVELQVVGVFRTFSRDYDARAIRIPLPSASELIDSSGVHAMVFSLDDVEATERVANEVRSLLSPAQFEVMTWQQLDDYYPKTVALYNRQLGVLQLIILGIVMLSVANSVGMTVQERAGEFGTLRALGRRGSDVLRLILLENLMLAALGASLGLLVSVVLAWAISQVGIPMPPPPNANSGYTAHIRLTALAIASGLIVGVTATVLSSLLAARRAARMPIVEALRANV